MDASELSEQIRQSIESGEWSLALSALAGAWGEVSEFGTVYCHLPDYPGVWVRFATRGYPFRLRREWESASTDAALIGIILPRVTAWNMPDVDGNPIPLPSGERGIEILNDADDSLVVWLLRAFWRFWRIELPVPRKN